MEFNISLGIQGRQTKIVEQKDTALKHESGSAKVYATPAMIALMEKTAFLSIDELLPTGWSSVGIEIKAQHLKASLPGAIISCISELINIDNKKVTFTISASDEKGIIGKAEHTRYLINSEAFMEQLTK